MKKSLLLAGFLISRLINYAQTSQPYFNHFSIEDGLPVAEVYAIADDADGYIWIGTNNGIVRYDGYQFKNYVLGENRLKISPIDQEQAIISDNQKNIWVSGSNNSLYKYNASTDSFRQFIYPPENMGSDMLVKTADNEGNIWGLLDQDKSRIVKFDIKNRRFEHFDKNEKGTHHVNANRMFAVQKISDGSIWFCTDNGLYKYKSDGKLIRDFFVSADTAKQLVVHFVYEPPSEPGILWAYVTHGRSKKQIIRLDSHAGTVTIYPMGKNAGAIRIERCNDIHEDKQKQLWLATDSGLSKFDRTTGHVTNYAPADTFSHYLFKIHEVKSGSFWITTYNGVLKFDPKNNNFTRCMSPGSMQGWISINQGFIDQTGIFWGAGNGIFQLDKIKSSFQFINTPSAIFENGRARVFFSKNKVTLVNGVAGVYSWLDGTAAFKQIYKPLPGEAIMAAFAGRDSNLFIGTTKGLVLYNGVTHKTETYILTPPTVQPITYPVFQDHNGIIWAGAGERRGITSFNPVTKKITHYPYLPIEYGGILRMNNMSGALDDNFIGCIYEDRENTLWVGTLSGGVNWLDAKTGKFHSFFNWKNRAMQAITAMYEDKRGRFWVASGGTGLFEVDRKNGSIIKHFDDRSGLISREINNVAEDNAGFIWVFSESGLSKIDPDNMNIMNFKFGDVFHGESPWEWAQVKLSDGRFVFGLQHGLAIVDPKDLVDTTPPRVHLESVASSNPRADDKAANHVLTYGRQQLILSYDQNRVQFNYVALNYHNPALNTYAYQLENYDKQLVNAGTVRSVTYNNLSPGTYTFRVIAANSSGVWNKKGDSITIIIDAPWWLRWWAWLLWIVLFVSAIYGFVAYRSRKLIRDKRALEHKVHIRTEEVMQQKEEIESQRDNLKKAFGDLKATQTQLIQSEKMASLGELTAGIAHEIQNPLNFVNNFSEVNTELIGELKLEVDKGDLEEIKAIAGDIEENSKKINIHGNRAAAIVKGMLEHSRAGSGQKEPTDINALADEYLRLSYHGLRAKDKNFNAEMVTNLDVNLPKVNVIPQDIGRVLLNLFNNAFYAVSQKQKTAEADYKPTVEVTTFAPPSGGWGVKVKDNGVGIPEAIKEKIMQPFFTTKPTGEGTGLGLSLTYDMVVKGHGGSIQVESVEGKGSEFIVKLPLN